MLVKDQIKKLQRMDPEDNIALHTWHTNDVAYQDESLTPEQCNRVIDMMENEQDCTIGLNWDVMDIWISWVKAESRIKAESEED